MNRILIIDDDEAIRSFCRMALQAEGFEALAVPSGSQALKFLRVHTVDLVLVDVVMPDMDGIELIRKVQERLPGMPIIAMSGGGVFGAKECLKFAQEIGANLVLPKPFELAELIRGAQGLLAQLKN